MRSSVAAAPLTRLVEGVEEQGADCGGAGSRADGRAARSEHEVVRSSRRAVREGAGPAGARHVVALVGALAATAEPGACGAMEEVRLADVLLRERGGLDAGALGHIEQADLGG